MEANGESFKEEGAMTCPGWASFLRGQSRLERHRDTWERKWIEGSRKARVGGLKFSYSFPFPIPQKMCDWFLRVLLGGSRILCGAKEMNLGNMKVQVKTARRRLKHFSKGVAFRISQGDFKAIS